MNANAKSAILRGLKTYAPPKRTPLRRKSWASKTGEARPARGLRRRSKGERPKAVAANDRDHSMFIRIRDKRQTGGYCVFGCGRHIGCAFHFYTRIHTATRWDDSNVVGSCSGCNMENEYRPAKYQSWFIDRYGAEAWAALGRKSQTIVKWGVPELKAINAEIRAKLKKICLDRPPTV